MPPTRVDVKPRMLRWARERARAHPESLLRRFPRLPNWEAGDAKPTLKQLEDFSRVTHAPFGYFFLQEPPAESIPIPDFRTVSDHLPQDPSADLLDTIYICQQRQAWYRDYCRVEGEPSKPFVGSARVGDNVEEVASSIRHTLRFDIEERRWAPTWTDALRRFIEQVDDAGILVMVNGVVANNTHRKLDPDEFRGFALPDELAPIVFINGADTKAAQMFTLAHELAHVWVNQAALDDVQPSKATQDAERWCNAVAAELLVPLALLAEHYRANEEIRSSVDRLARHFKVSTLVILRRLFESDFINKDQFWTAYRAELERLRGTGNGSGGNFYLTQAARVGKRFARALVTSTLEGHTLYRDALHLLGFSNMNTFKELGQSLGVS